MKPKKLEYRGTDKVKLYLQRCVNWLLDNSGKTEVNVEPSLSSGVKVADITVDEETTSIFAPNPPAVKNNISEMNDVELTNLADGQILKYDNTEEKWVNANETGGTEVEANPQGTPTDTLNTISIDGVIYGIEGGDAPVVETELIPLMTSDTTPSGTVSYSSQFGTNYAGYMAFNREQANISMMTGGWLPSNADTAPYLQYTWDSPQKLSKLWIETANNGGSVSRTITVQGYNGTSWENCLKSGNTVLLDFENGQYEEFEIELNGQNYSAIKIEGNEQWFYINSTACTISRMQVYSVSGGSSGKKLSDLSDVELTNLSDGQILQYNSTTEKWENADNQGSLPFEFAIDPTDNGINIVYDDGGE